MNDKKRQKKEIILQAAIQVFAEYGYNAKMSKIAEVAGVGAGSLYLYYKNKNDILHGIFLHIWESIVANVSSLENRQDMTPIEKMDAIIDAFFDIVAQNSSLAVVFTNESGYYSQITDLDIDSNPHSKQFFRIVEATLADGSDQGYFKPSLDPVFVPTLSLEDCAEPSSSGDTIRSGSLCPNCARN